MMRTVVRFAAAITVLGFGFSVLSAGPPGKTNVVKVRDLMTADQFDRAGLAKLTPTELAVLEEWLRTYTEAVRIVAQSSANNPAPPSVSSSRRAPSTTSDVIETCIEGDFQGWEGDTLFKLCNGQIWQQAEYSYTYEYAYRPEVIIYKTAAGYRMKVEDVAETIAVRRLK